MQKDGVDIQENYTYISDEKKSRKLNALNVLLSVVIILLIVALIVFTTTFTSFKVIGESMLPNVKEGDRLVLQKRGYTLEYGDIVVFNRQEDSEAAVKRILGKAGDTIAFDKQACKWVRNGEYVEENYYEDECEYNEVYFSSMLWELQGEGITIPEGHLFVLGDNRNIIGGYSYDSHHYGPLPESSVIGKVIYIMD
ncbi:MAG: signal peptidase I [Clostridiales bacterium]|nr:signal peptidase I [Clostridiales bacterium]